MPIDSDIFGIVLYHFTHIIDMDEYIIFVFSVAERLILFFGKRR